MFGERTTIGNVVFYCSVAKNRGWEINLFFLGSRVRRMRRRGLKRRKGCRKRRLVISRRLTRL